MGDLAATGFGTVTSDVGRQLVNLGADVRFVSQNDVDTLDEPFMSRTLSLPSITFEPDAENPDGAIQDMANFTPDLIAGNASRLTMLNGDSWGDWKPDVVFLLGDFYGMRLMATPYLDAFASVPTFHYVPIEGHDLPPAWADVWRVITPIAMSRFGQDAIEKVTGTRPPLVYHGVDAETFHPVSPSSPVYLPEPDGKKITLSSKAACKYALRIDPRMTVVLRADRNMPRKGYSALIRAMAPVMRERPNVMLLLHCREMDQGGSIADTTSKYPDIADRIVMPSQLPVPREVLVAIYNAADLYVTTSAEGFGLTIAEAIACGVPAVGLDYSAVPEVIGPAGVVVPVGRLLDNEYAHHWALPDEDAFGKAVAYLIDHPHRRLEQGRMGPAHVARNFRWDVAAERFMEIAQESLERPQTADKVRELVAA